MPDAPTAASAPAPASRSIDPPISTPEDLVDLPAPLRGVLRLEAATLRAVLRLPRPVLRAIAGPAISIDGQTLDVETQTMLRLQRASGKPPVETLPVPQGRAALDALAATLGGRLPVAQVRALDVAGRPARLYTPTALAAPMPLLVFFHGGGFFQGGLDSHDPTCRLLAERGRVRVLAVDYRLGPEHAFPAAHDDAVAAYRWVLDHLDELGADADRLAVGGDSAGGNLAAWVALTAAREGWPLRTQLLVYPATESAARDTASSRLFASGFFLSREYIDNASTHYTPRAEDRADPRVSPLRAEVPAGLARALVFTAGFDPLRDEGEAYAAKLAAAGVPVEAQRFPDLIHSFFNMVGVGRRSADAVAHIADRLWVSLHP